MILFTTETVIQRATRNLEYTESIIENTRRYIRERFDKCRLSTHAESWITIAKEQGFTELANEMERDLKTELLTA